MKTLKLSRAEMQKIFARPGIFIMAFLFILTIAGSAFIFALPNRSNGVVTIIGSDVQTIYNTYNSSNPNLLDSKAYYDAQLSSIQNAIISYTTPSTPIDSLQEVWDDMWASFNSFTQNVYSNPASASSITAKHNLKGFITDFKDLYNQIQSQNEEAYTILITEQNHISILQFLTQLENTIPDDDEADNQVILDNLNNLNFLNVLQNKIDNIQPFEVNEDTINLLNSYYLVQTNEKLFAIDTQINNFYTTNPTSNVPADLQEIKRLISNYKLTIAEFEVIVYNSIYLNAFESYTNTQVNNFKHFNGVNLYEMKENLTRNLYLFTNNKYEYEYARAFSVVSPSNVSANAFDFAYFTLELFSFIIIIYVVVLGSGMIAGEERDGTLKLLAMRPFKRYKIFLGKILASLRVGAIFLIIGAIASFITGSYLFGTTSLPMLSVFNAEYIITMSPYLMFAIYLLTIFVEILFYTILAVSISSIFKSYTGAVTISILIYFMSMILSFVTGAPWLRIVPLTNTNLFNYFGGAFVNSSAISGINALLTPPILLDTNFIFSAITLFATIIIFLSVALQVFSRRDLK